MNILFMMPGWNDGTGPWMLRMMEALGPDLKAIVVNDSRGELFWKHKVPIFSVNYPPKEIHYLSRLFKLVGFSLKKNPPDANKYLQKIIKQFSITHVLCQYGTYAVQFLETWQKTDLQLFVHFHGYDATFDLRSYKDPERKQHNNRYLESIKTLSKRAIFIANSEFCQNMLIEGGIDPKKVEVKYIGTTIPENAKFHEKAEGITIIQLGRLVDCKSPDRTIKAFEIAKSKGLKGTLQLVGDGPLRPTCELLQRRSEYKDSIYIFGAVDWEEGQKILSGADIFTQHNIEGELTHQSEAFGVSILEAMSFGLSVVCSRHGGVVESVVDGGTGIMFEPGDVEAQADAFLKLATDPDLRQQMGNLGRKRVAEVFSVEREAQKLREIIEYQH